MIIELSLIITLLYASYLDIKTRIIPFKTWIPVIAVGVAFSPTFTPLWLSLVALFTFSGYTKIPKLYHVVLALITINAISFFTPDYNTIALLCLVCGVFYAISCFNVFGGADAFALIWIALFIEPYSAIITFLIAVMIGGAYMVITKKELMYRSAFLPFITIGFVVVFLSQYL